VRNRIGGIFLLTVSVAWDSLKWARETGLAGLNGSYLVVRQEYRSVSSAGRERPGTGAVTCWTAAKVVRYVRNVQVCAMPGLRSEDRT
jgi:hypothetical protein